MAHCLIVGFGALGQSLAKQLMASGHTVTGLRRQSMPLQGEMRVLCADVMQPTSLSVLSEIELDVVVYCVSADNASPEAYQAAYVDGLRNIIAACAKRPPRWFFFVSSTRVYGQASSASPDALLDEATPAIPNDLGGELLLAGEQLLMASSSPLFEQSTVLRFSGIYGPGRERLIRLSTHPEQWPEQNAWSNRIHQEDGARFIGYLIDQVLHQESTAPLYIVTDSCPVGLHEVLRWIAQQQGLETTSPIKEVNGGKRLSNQGLRDSGFVLRYPDYRAGYGEMLMAIDQK